MGKWFREWLAPDFDYGDHPPERPPMPYKSEIAEPEETETPEPPVIGTPEPQANE